MAFRVENWLRVSMRTAVFEVVFVDGWFAPRLSAPYGVAVVSRVKCAFDVDSVLRAFRVRGAEVWWL